MASYRLTSDDAGKTHLIPADLFESPFENGPGDFKGVGGAVMGDARRVMLMRFESGSRPGFHRALPCFAVLLSGELVVNDSSGGEVVLSPGDSIRVEPNTPGRFGGWRLGNRQQEYALLALVQMPASPGTSE